MRRPVVIVAATVLVLAVVATAIAIYVNGTAKDPYAAFQKSCLAQTGSVVVTLATTTRTEYMGPGAKKYTLGCRGPAGAITSRIVTNHP